MSIWSALSGRMTDAQLAELRTQSRAPRPEVKSSRQNRMPPAELNRVRAQSANVTEDSKLLITIMSGSRSDARKAREVMERRYKPKKVDQMLADKAKELRPKENKGWFSW